MTWREHFYLNMTALGATLAAGRVMIDRIARNRRHRQAAGGPGPDRRPPALRILRPVYDWERTCPELRR